MDFTTLFGRQTGIAYVRKESMTSEKVKYQIRLLKPDEYDVWNQFTEEAPSGNLFHSTRWANIIRQVFGRSFEILALFKKETLQAGFLYWPKQMLHYPLITQTPLTPYQSFVLKQSAKEKPSAGSAEFHTLSNLLLKKLLFQFRHIDLATVPGATDVRPFIWQNFSARPRYTYTFPILPFGELQKQFSQALRRKTKKYAAEFSVIESKQPEELWQFVLASYRHHGIAPPVNARKLSEFFSVLSQTDWAHFFYLNKNDRPLAALLLLEDGRHVFALFAGVRQQERTGFVSEYLYTQALKQPAFLGKQFDFLGANTPDFEQFKRSFGGQLQVYFELNLTRGKTLQTLSRIRKRQHLLVRRKRRND